MSPSPPWAISFRTALLRATLYTLAIGGIAQGGYLEVLYLPEVRYTELGFTEFTQTLVLASCCALLIYGTPGTQSMAHDDTSTLSICVRVTGFASRTTFWITTLPTTLGKWS